MFRDRSHHFEIYDAAEVFTRYQFHCADIMDLDDVVDDSVLERKRSVTPTLALRCR